MSDEYLCQSGIKGMHWGVRRYQNPDGTLTDAGKRRLSKYQDRQIAKIDKKIEKNKKKQIKKGGNYLRSENVRLRAEKKTVASLSYDEMRKEQKATRNAYMKKATAMAAGIAVKSAVTALTGNVAYGYMASNAVKAAGRALVKSPTEVKRKMR